MKENEFKGSSIEEATRIGLESLGLTAEEADVQVINDRGIFSKAAVIVTPKAKTVEAVQTAVEEKAEEFEPAQEVTEGEPKAKSSAYEYLEGILSRMNLKVTIEEKEKPDEICFYIGGEEASGAIGHRGDTLDAIQYLVSQYINKGNDGEERIRVTVDADFYREKRKRTLISLAKRLAKDALRTKKEIALEPMNSYERRIIHAALQDSPDATTRSEGEGKERYVIITPKCELLAYGGEIDFKKNGPSKTRSFGYEKKKF